MKYAYLHGFASSSLSTKGQQLADLFEKEGIELLLPDLNNPSFEELTYTGMVEAMDAFDEEHGDGEKWRFIGSSMGGFIASRWAELNPGRVDRTVLLCPGFNMSERWAEILGESGIEDWEEEGSFLFFDPEDNLIAVHWELYRDARDEHPAYPEVDCPVLIMHGKHDQIVPLESSKKFVEMTPDSELSVLDDDHKLHDSIEEIGARALDFFGEEGLGER